MPKRISQPEKIHLRIVEVMKRFPEGIPGGRIRHELEREGILPDDLGNLARRIRELDNWFIIEETTVAQTAEGDWQVIRDKGQISGSLRAEVLYGARGRCQRCGKSIKSDSITLVVQPKRPGSCEDVTYRDDLWAICESCIAEKKAHLIRPMITGARPRFRCCRASTNGK